MPLGRPQGDALGARADARGDGRGPLRVERGGLRHLPGDAPRRCGGEDVERGRDQGAVGARGPPREEAADRPEAAPCRRDRREHPHDLRGHRVRRREPVRERDVLPVAPPGRRGRGRARRRKWACSRSSGSPTAGRASANSPTRWAGRCAASSCATTRRGSPASISRGGSGRWRGASSRAKTFRFRGSTT